VFQLKLNKKEAIKLNVPFFSKIVKITFAIYQGLSKIRLRKEYLGRKVNNAPGVNFRRNFVFVPYLSFPGVIAWPEPVIQSDLKSGHLKTKHATS